MTADPEGYFRLVAEAIESCSLPSVGGDRFRFDPDLHGESEFASFGFDSLTTMEFCIAIHCSTGVELSLGDVARLQTPRAITEYLTART
ncbi:MAG: acyl carrier protein [Gallionellaceae bacterium]|nr:acyl carrier protein [Gallionellaceae bacterium]MDD5364459.1 acyl carrier protein [Gallionellaceae bacterium]